MENLKQLKQMLSIVQAGLDQFARLIEAEKNNPTGGGLVAAFEALTVTNYECGDYYATNQIPPTLYSPLDIKNILACKWSDCNLKVVVPTIYTYLEWLNLKMAMYQESVAVIEKAIEEKEKEK
jgi:hypothetical protein